MKIGIIGAGVASLGLCYHLLCQEKSFQVTLFDLKGIGGGSSGISAGLLHPYPGENARLSWQGNKALESAVSLLEVASLALGRKVMQEGGILRVALNEEQERMFRECAETRRDAQFWSAQTCREKVKGMLFFPGIFICSARTVYSKLYLQGLWKACEQLGARFEKKEVDVGMLRDFDHVVIAAGSGIRKFKECRGLPVKYNKGQLLVCKKPPNFDLNFSLIGKGYLALSEMEEKCYLGSTYEHEFVTEEPCMRAATDEILSKVKKFFPFCESFKIQDCLSGLRVSNRKGPLPLVRRLKKGLWIVTAMGSRGFLYHSLVGQKLSQAIKVDDETFIPKELLGYD